MAATWITRIPEKRARTGHLVLPSRKSVASGRVVSSINAARSNHASLLKPDLESATRLRRDNSLHCARDHRLRVRGRESDADMTFEFQTSVRSLGDRIRMELDLRFWPDQELKLGSSHSREVAVAIDGHATCRHEADRIFGERRSG